MTLTDGGVYDNLGLETVWKEYRTVLVNDGGGKMQPDTIPWYAHNWFSQLLRVHDITDNQVRALRKRAVIDAYQLGPANPEYRAGTYWGIWSDISNYQLPTSLPCPVAATTQLAATPTRLAKLPQLRQARLINWGYAVCDTALRRWVEPTLPVPTGFPYPLAGVG